MSFHSSISGFFIILTLSCLVTCGKNEKSNSTFQPTNEWQKIEEGVTIPPGLHVRINLQTGYKEAKLPDNKYGESEVKSLVKTKDEDENHDKPTPLDANELKRILKNIKSEDTPNDSDTPKKFRSYDELKRHFDELNIQVKTDIEIITSLTENFKKFNVVRSNNVDRESIEETEDEEILLTLVDLEYLVHQYDNAKQFAKLNGFPEVIHKSLNSTNGNIRSEALRLHGSATQSNPKVQIAALDSGSINLLLKILTFDEDINVRSRALYALSCLLRRFPAAQQKLITDGGLTVFANIFDEEKDELLKLQIKIITLIHDILFERKDTKMNILEEENANRTNAKLEDLKERLRQYQKIDIENKLVEQNWCKKISNWFVKQNFLNELHNFKGNNEVLQASILENHDVIEKVVDTLYVLFDICKVQFQIENELIQLLLNLRDIYSKLASAEEDSKESGQFYSSLSNILKILTDKLHRKESVKDEL